MSATDELRRLLDERGVEYRVSATGYSIDIGPSMTAYANRTDTTLDVSLRGFTPEQAIDATLGQGTCRDVCAGISEFTCSSCGFNCDLASWISMFDGDEGRHRHHHHGTPNYCPNCGRKVKED